jgi:hypothetical protein
VAQRFTAAINGLSSVPASAAEVMLRRDKHFSRNLFSRAANANRDVGFSPCGRR